MKLQKEIKKELKWCKDNPRFTRNTRYTRWFDGYMSALEWVLHDNKLKGKVKGR